MRKIIVFSLLMFVFVSGCFAPKTTEPVNDGDSAKTVSEPVISKSGLSDGLAVEIFYASMAKDPDSLSPNVTYPSKMTVSGADKEEAAENALKMLLAGPSPEDKDKGFYSAIPEGTKLNFVKKEGGRIIADFSSKLNEGGGSCDMQQRRSQIENTLKSIYTDPDDEIIISVEGNSEQVLQP